LLGLSHGNPSPQELKEITIDPSTTAPNMIDRVFGASVESLWPLAVVHVPSRHGFRA
jgi:hypothetical protein